MVRHRRKSSRCGPAFTFARKIVLCRGPESTDDTWIFRSVPGFHSAVVLPKMPCVSSLIRFSLPRSRRTSLLNRQTEKLNLVTVSVNGSEYLTTRNRPSCLLRAPRARRNPDRLWLFPSPLPLHVQFEAMYGVFREHP